jgi:C-terminal peptidase prc
MLRWLLVAWIALAGIAVMAVVAGSARSKAAATAPTATDDEDADNEYGAERLYASQVNTFIDYIAENYMTEIAPEVLAARAIQALFDKAGKPLPDHLKGDLVTYLKGRDLHRELFRARQAAGTAKALTSIHAAVRTSIEGMMGALDPYSAYLHAEDQTRGDLNVGIGVTLEDRVQAGPCHIRTVALDGPALRAGIRPGDQLLEVNGQAIPPELSAAQIQRRYLDGSPDSKVTLRIRPMPEGEPKTVQVRRESFRESPVKGVRRLGSRAEGEEQWDFLIDPVHRLGYVRYGTISRAAVQALFEAFQDMRAIGITGMVLDLRECPGGTLDDAADTADCFLPPGKLIARLRYRNPRNASANVDAFVSQPSPRKFLLPMVVLVGPDTMGGGELIAATLQDHGRAAIVGQRTRGKGSIQQPSRVVVDNHVIRLSVGFYERPSGQPLQRYIESKPRDPWGVRPDDDLALPLPAVVHRQVRAWRLLSDLRPETATHSLPLDRPENDPILELGLRHLRTLIK